MGRDLTSLRLPETLRPGNQALVNLAERHGLELVVLFGSRAKGTAHPTSDFDLAVLPEAGTPGGCGSDAKGLLSAEDARRLMALHTDLQHLLRTDRIDLVPLQCASALLAHRIARDGLPLYERAPGAFAGSVSDRYNATRMPASWPRRSVPTFGGSLRNRHRREESWH